MGWIKQSPYSHRVDILLKGDLYTNKRTNQKKIRSLQNKWYDENSIQDKKWSRGGEEPLSKEKISSEALV